MSIRATARKAALAAFEAAGDVVLVRRLRMNGTTTVDAAADTAAVVWGFEQDLRSIAYDDTEEREDRDPAKDYRNFLFLGVDLAGNAPSEDATVTDEAGREWQTWLTEVDPTASVAIFYCRSPRPTAPP